VREESHLEEMRSAIRGDFERLAERRGDQELMRVADDEPQPEPEEPLEAELEMDARPEEHRSWLARLFSPPHERDSE
jgi:hypothetical protein